MKLFEETEEKIKAVYALAEDEKGNKQEILISPERTVMKMNDETVKYILSAPSGSTMTRIRYLIANIYNHNTYPYVDIFGLLRNADQEHQELAMDIIGISQSKYGESCFQMIEELAPVVIDTFKIKSFDQEEE